MQNIIFLVMRRMRVPLILLISTYALSILGFVLIPGRDDQGQPWVMDFFHAIYFVSYMGSTIGFGEIPYPFTDAQRLWALMCIYGTVIAWLYCIGTMIALVQTPSFRAAVTRNGFVRQVRRMREPFHIVCGYGDTGQALVRALTHNGNQCVVVEKASDRVNELELELEELPSPVPALNADASDSQSLLDAGLRSPFCNGVIAVTRDDQVNLKVAIACKLLNRDIKVYCWAETHDTGRNMASFDTDHVVYPYDVFAQFLADALSRPSYYLLQQWLSSAHQTPLTDPVFPPSGKWVLCGFGRFGRAVHGKLVEQGLPVTVITEDMDATQPPDGSVSGRGTEAETLIQAGLEDAVGVIAGTDHDVNNLSIILTARAIKPSLFCIARQEFAENNQIFSAAGIDLVTNHSQLLSSTILSLITTPLTADFLARAGEMPEEWSRTLISRLIGCVDEFNPVPWVITLRPERTPEVMELFNDGGEFRLHHLQRSPENRKRKQPCVALLLQRGGERILLPEPDTVLAPYDRILFAGDPSIKQEMISITTSPYLLGYMISGRNQPRGSLWRWLSGFTGRQPGGQSE